MAALSAEDTTTALRELESGLALAQEIPALTADMQRLRDNLANAAISELPPANASTQAPIYLAGYGYGRTDDAE